MTRQWLRSLARCNPPSRRHRRGPGQPFRPHLEDLEARQVPSTFTVTTTADSGPGSLRQAILDANANPGLDTIAFAIDPGGVQTIRPAAALPAVTDPLLLDGTSQPGFAGSPLIVLDGRAAGFSANGLKVTADQSTIRGLVIDDFQGSGIVLRGCGTQVTGNYLGIDVTGTQAAGNAGAGVRIAGGSNDTVGGTAPGAGNVIAFNGRDGVRVNGGSGDAILGNAIFANAGPGIALRHGANQGQPFPQLTAAAATSSSLRVRGALTSAPLTTYRLEFFANAVCNPSGYGDGAQFLGAATVTTDGGGTATFSTDFAADVPAGQYVTATATDPGGDTSSFSRCVAVSPAPPTVVANTDDRGPGSLRQALADTQDGGTVTFDAALAGQTIALTSGELAITKSVAIAGPGADQLTISGNHQGRVFDISQSGLSVTIAGLAIANGATPATNQPGGGIYMAGGNVTLSHCALVNNGTQGHTLQAVYGGAVYVAGGNLTVIYSTLSANQAAGGSGATDRQLGEPGLGGGIYIAGGSVQINSSTLSSNQATGGDSGGFTGNPGAEGTGGGVYMVGGSLVVTDSTFTANRATGGMGSSTFLLDRGGAGGQGSGGGIYVLAGTVVVTDSTFAANQATGGMGGMGRRGPGPSGAGLGAGLAAAATTTLRNTIIAANSANPFPDVNGTLVSLGHNLIGDGTGGHGFAASDLVGTTGAPIDPQLEPLGDYGGPTQTLRPLPTSPAVDAGDNTDAPPTDQRGFDRIVNGTIDIGAVELQPGELGGAPRLHSRRRASSSVVAEGSRVIPALVAGRPQALPVGESALLPTVPAARLGSAGDLESPHQRDTFFQLRESSEHRGRNDRPTFVARAGEWGFLQGLLPGVDRGEDFAIPLS